MNEALVIYFILKLPIVFNIGIIFMVLGVFGLVGSTLIMARAEYLIKSWIIYCISVAIVGLALIFIFPNEKQANIMALAYAGFEGIEAVKEMTGDSDITKNSIEAYNTLLEKYIEENSTKQE